MPEAALVDNMAEDKTVSKRKRKLDFFSNEQPQSKKRPENGIGLTSRSMSLGKRKQPTSSDTAKKSKRPRVSTGFHADNLQPADEQNEDQYSYEDVFNNLSVIEMPLSIRAQAYLQDPQERPGSREAWKKQSNTAKSKLDEGYGGGALVLYSPPPTLPYSNSNDLDVHEPTVQMDLD
ncbi:hypothetical protein IWW36_001793 [Coemansia brasiliensis]|uniref:Uncharacterized protein n=1 Tax=Coemansia brasiliensis TaxID=2650707 RepID=A0A9W8I926_9FUNG|nr:hypothetical protein IWW36_001793 [Coemansia brasiliensis]